VDAPIAEVDAPIECSPPCVGGNVCVMGACACPPGACCPGCAPGQTCTGGSCVACGHGGEPCCGTTCEAGLACSSDRCAPCGGPGAACCPGGGCSDGARCESGICRGECGGTSQPCCGGDRCGPGLACVETGFPFGRRECVACGGMSEPCCAGMLCDSDALACVRGTCSPPEPCGGAFQACCPPGMTCEMGRTCLGSVCL
jgi:hypothetical protein